MQKSKFYKIAEDEQIEFTINSTYKYPQRINKYFLIFGLIWSSLPTFINILLLSYIDFKVFDFQKEFYDFINLNQEREVYILTLFQIIGISIILFSLKINKTPGNTHIITNQRMIIESSIDCNSYTWNLFLPKIEIEDDALLLKLRTGKMVKGNKRSHYSRDKIVIVGKEYYEPILESIKNKISNNIAIDNEY